MQFLINLFLSGPWIFVAPPVFVGAIILFRRTRTVAAILQVIGSAAYLVLYIFDLTFGWVLGQESLRTGNTLLPIWAQHWSFNLVRIILELVILCFPVGFLWFSLRATRRT